MLAQAQYPPTYSNKYLTDTEYCLYFHSGKGKVHPACYDDGKTFYVSGTSFEGKELGHPNAKPLEFVKRMVSNSSEKGGLVFDPFMGSGTTGVACKEIGRDFIGCEINPDYFKIANERINEVSYSEKSLKKLF